MKYLKFKQHYIDLYDKLTVDQCRRLVKIQIDSSSIKSPLPKEERKRMEKVVNDISLYCFTGERYKLKAETIQEWMDRDKALDDKITNANPPSINCLHCGNKMECIEKDLTPLELDQPILFMYHCKNCNKRRAFYDDGKEFVSSMTKEEIEEFKKEMNEMIAKPKKKDPHFEKDRKKYCLSEEEGSNYISAQANVKDMVKRMKEKEEEAEKLKTLKTLSFPEVKKLITELFKTHNLSDIQFSQPEVGRDVKIAFTAISEADLDSDDLLKILVKTLEDTNWQLQSKCLGYKLGVIVGKLQGS